MEMPAFDSQGTMTVLKCSCWLANSIAERNSEPIKSNVYMADLQWGRNFMNNEVLWNPDNLFIV